MNDAADVPSISGRSAFVRACGFLGFWLIIAGTKPGDLPAGLFATVIATAVSLYLLPPGRGRIRPILLGMLAVRFLRQSLIAGIDVAWRALHPRMRLRPGFVTYESQLDTGPARDAFCTLTSLLPGTLPTSVDLDGDLLIHCLDTGQPIAEQLAFEENLFAKAMGVASRDG